MAEKTPKLRIKEFLRHTLTILLTHIQTFRRVCYRKLKITFIVVEILFSLFSNHKRHDIIYVYGICPQYALSIEIVGGIFT